MITWLPPVDWSEPVEDVRRYLTDVLTGTDGNEQRRQLRARPRRTIRYRSVLLERGEATRILEGLRVLGGAWATVPLWCDATVLTSAAALGGTALTCDTTGREFRTGVDAALLVRDSQTFELLRVETVTSTGLTVHLDEPLQAAWAAGTAVVPLVRGRMLSPAEFEWVTDQEAILTVLMEAEA